MKVHVAAIGGHPLADTVRELGVRHGARSVVVDSPGEADLVVLCGSFARSPGMLTEDPLYRSFRDKCAVYSGDDAYSPIAPGVYTSPRRGPSTLVGRVRSHAYASSYGIHGNHAVLDTGSDLGRARLTGGRAEGVLLFSFEGSASSRVRRRLFSLSCDPDEAVVVDTTSAYKHFDHSASGREGGQRRYVDTMMRSRFALCPRGEGTGTLRLFEAMSLGVAPVLISDRYVLPRGPRWEDFLVRVPEHRMLRLVPILRNLAASSADRGRRAREEWLEWFAPEVLFDRLVEAADAALRAGAPLEGIYRSSARLWGAGTDLGRRVRLALR